MASSRWWDDEPEEVIVSVELPTAAARAPGWPQGLSLLAPQILPAMGPLLLVPGVPLIIVEYGAMKGAAYWIPILLTMPSLCIALFSFTAGLIGDRLGRRIPLVAAVGLYALAGTAPLYLMSFPAIFATRIVLGICEALIMTLSVTMLTDYFSGHRRDRWLAMISFLGSASAVVILAVAGLVGARYGWRAPTAIYGIALLIVPALVVFTWEPSHHAEEAFTTNAAPFPWAHTVTVGSLTLLGGLLFFVATIQPAFGLLELGIDDPGRIGRITAVAGLGNPIGAILFTRLVALRTAHLLAFGFVLMGSGLLAMCWAAGPWSFGLANGAALLGAGMLLPTLMTWMMRGMPFAARARGAGVFQSLFFFGQFLSGLLVPFLARHGAHSVLGAFAFLGVLALFLGIASLAMESDRTRRSQSA